MQKESEKSYSESRNKKSPMAAVRQVDHDFASLSQIGSIISIFHAPYVIALLTEFRVANARDSEVENRGYEGVGRFLKRQVV